MTIGSEALRHRIWRERLLEQLPDLDEVTLADTLEGLTDLREILAELVRSALVDEALCTGLSTRLSEMRARAHRLEVRAEKKRAMVLAAMTEAQIQTLLLPDFTASLKRAPPAVEVLAEEAIPQSFWKPQPPKLDRQALLASLKEGATIAGVCLAASRLQLSVRTK